MRAPRRARVPGRRGVHARARSRRGARRRCSAEPRRRAFAICRRARRLTHGRSACRRSPLENVSKHWTTADGEVRAVDDLSFAFDAGHAQRAARPVGLRQVDDAAADRRPRDRRRRPHPDRRPRRHARCRRRSATSRWCSRATRCFPHLTVAENIVFGLHVRKVAAAECARAARARGRRCSGLAPLLDAQAVAALRRPAAARRARPRDHRRGAGVPDGRAAVEPRRAAARRDAPGDPRAAAQARHHDGVRHARPGRGDVDGRPRRAAERRADRAERRRRSTSTRRRPTRSSRASSARRR